MPYLCSDLSQIKHMLRTKVS